MSAKEMENLAELVALKLCHVNEVKPEDYEEWWLPNSSFYNPLAAFQVLKTMDYKIVKVDREP